MLKEILTGLSNGEICITKMKNYTIDN